MGVTVQELGNVIIIQPLVGNELFLFGRYLYSDMGIRLLLLLLSLLRRSYLGELVTLVGADGFLLIILLLIQRLDNLILI